MSKKWTCDFCNRTEDEVAHIVVTQSEVAICDECVATCNELIAEASRPSDVKVKVRINISFDFSVMEAPVPKGSIGVRTADSKAGGSRSLRPDEVAA
ncbi:ClpX C4-type zinc finger protein [Burkholderia multivorans]|uniref:ClpX C4-type zinc finger protein n=1 Tax=Burkholderia multivorans TaxID=87883 RepID=UPI0020B3A886|nr:ClpX C4-type zinc finger protein [Burkholderia multivorans]